MRCGNEQSRMPTSSLSEILPEKITSPAECFMIIGDIYHDHAQTTQE